MADYSHLLKLRPAMVGVRYERGKPVTDEMLHDALQRIEPPLLAEAELDAVNAILRGKRGRIPKDSPSRELLARIVMQANRPDVPRQFIAALSDRLLRRKRITELDRCRKFERARYMRDRNMFIRSLYREFYRLQDGRDFVIHPIAKCIEVPMHVRTRSGRALAMTSHYVGQMLGYDVPSRLRMMNIISGN